MLKSHSAWATKHAKSEGTKLIDCKKSCLDPPMENKLIEEFDLGGDSELPNFMQAFPSK